MLLRMGTTKRRSGRFRKVGENLYRYSSNGVYYAVFRSHGKLIWKSLRTDDRELGKRKLKEALEKHGRAEPSSQSIALEALLGLYKSQLAQFDERTRANKLSVLKKFKTTWVNGFDVPVRSITAADLQLWLNKDDVMRNSNSGSPTKHAGENHGSKRVSKWTYNQYVRFLRQLFAIAVDARAVIDSPAIGLKTKTPEKPIRLTPTWGQFHAIVENIRQQRCELMDVQDSADLIEFMGTAGVGTAECANLLGEHIDFAKKRILLYRNKTDASFSVPIFPQLIPLLEKLKQKKRIMVGQSVFRVRDPKKTLSSACRRLNFPHFSPRALRRCFITRAIELGVDFKTVASWQGHNDGGALIAKTYSHLRNEHSERMAEKLVSPSLGVETPGT